MKKITIEINTTNAAFEEDAHAEVARILRDMADALEMGVKPYVASDINGNKVGKAEYEYEDLI